MPVAEIIKLPESPMHEARTGAVSIMDFRIRDKKTEAGRKEMFNLYIKRHDRINNWDLVDRAAIYVVGSWLYDKPSNILYKLAKIEKYMEAQNRYCEHRLFYKKRRFG